MFRLYKFGSGFAAKRHEIGRAGGRRGSGAAGATRERSGEGGGAAGLRSGRAARERQKGGEGKRKRAREKDGGREIGRGGAAGERSGEGGGGFGAAASSRVPHRKPPQLRPRPVPPPKRPSLAPSPHLSFDEHMAQYLPLPSLSLPPHHSPSQARVVKQRPLAFTARTLSPEKKDNISYPLFALKASAGKRLP